MNGNWITRNRVKEYVEESTNKGKMQRLVIGTQKSIDQKKLNKEVRNGDSK